MGNVLVIAEKPSVAKTIANTLGAGNMKKGYMEGNGYIVSYAFGHLCEYAKPEAYDKAYKKWQRKDLPIFPDEWKIEVSSDKQEQFDILKKLLNRTDIEYVVNACDAGREGELIFHFVYEMAESTLPVRRLWISSMETEAIKEGFITLKDAEEYEGLKQAAIARSKADWLVGINGTRLFTTLYNGCVLKVGRVQSPTLAMIVERDNEIDNFVSQPYYTIKLKTKDFTASSIKFQGKEIAEASLKLTENAKATVTRVSAENKKSQPPKLYDLTTLQRDANRMYGMTAKETLDTAQSLYEKKLMTYPRTDSRYLTNDMKKSAEDVMAIIISKLIREDINDFRPNTDKVLNSKKVSDHHAIIPTAELEKCNINTLSANELKILYMVSIRLLAAVSEPSRYSVTKVELDIHGLEFKTSGRYTEKMGYKRFEDILKNKFKPQDKNDDEDDNDVFCNILNLHKGQVIEDFETSLHEGWTKPPKRYTEDTLLAAMEKAGADETDPNAERKGIGTPATRAGIIEKLVYDKYVKRDKKYLTSTELGKNLVKILPEELLSAELTAEWENDLTLIAKGEAYADEFIDAIKTMVTGFVDTYKRPNPDMISAFVRKYKKRKKGR